GEARQGPREEASATRPGKEEGSAKEEVGRGASAATAAPRPASARQIPPWSRPALRPHGKSHPDLLGGLRPHGKPAWTALRGGLTCGPSRFRQGLAVRTQAVDNDRSRPFSTERPRPRTPWTPIRHARAMAIVGMLAAFHGCARREQLLAA